MKKIIPTIILGVFVAILLLPAMASAQPQELNECCKITGNFKIQRLKVRGEGVCVIGKAGGACIVDDSPIIIPTPASAVHTINDDVTCEPAEGVLVSLAYEEWGLICLVNSVSSVTNWIFYLLMIIAVVMVVIGGATYMLAAGSTERASKGKSIIIYGIVGLIIALLARLIPSVVKLIVGM